MALAHCVFEMHVHTENHASKGPIETFDNKCAGDLERVARVLAKSGFTRFIDDIGRRSVFVCVPSDFEKISKGEDARRVSVEEVCEAVQWLAGGHFRSSQEIEYLANFIKHG